MIGNLLFNIAPVTKIIFQLGYEPKDNYFYELTDEQYERLKNDNFDISSTWYLILPDEYKYQTYEALVVTEQEMNDLLEASKVIERYCDKSEKSFKTYEEKLNFVSNLLPPIFTDSSSYKKICLKIVEHGKA